MKIHSLENTGSISVDGVDIISLNPNGTIQLGTQTVFTVASYDEATATGGTITNQTIGNQIINGDLIVTGSLTAQQFIVSSSVTYLTTSFASGSTKFGDTLDDVHGFTGSLSISGSFIINGASYDTTTSGTSGANGSSGATGSSGSSGTDGTGGTSGTSGGSGSSGATGSSGSAGTSGTSGTATTSTRVEENFIATANQTTFTVTGGYTVGLVDVFVNGVRFLPTEYTATNGTTIVFDAGLMVNDEVTVLNYTSVITALPTSRNVQDFTATSGQTTFTVTNGYIVGLLDVFVNGSKLTSSEFTATNGTTFVLTVASTTGDQVQSINYTASVNGVSGAGTTNQLAYYTASSTLSSLTTATYPSLTELSYVKGVTSAIQTQLNAKAATLSGTTNYVPKFTSSSAIGDSAITDNGTTVTLVGRALSGTTATFSGAIYGARALFDSDFLSNETSKVGISFASGYGQINSWGANTSTYGGLKFQISVSNGSTVNALTLAPTGAATFSSSIAATTLTLNTTTADYAATITNVQDSSQGLLIRATDNDGTLNILNLQSSNATLGQTWVDRFTVTKGGNVGIGTSSPINKFAVIKSNTAGYYERTEALAVFQGSLPTVLIAHDGNSTGDYAELRLGNNQAIYYTYSPYIRGVQGAGINEYSLHFGTSSFGAASTRMIISTNGSIGAPSGTNIYNASDARLKKNISTTTYGLDVISALNPVKFNWIDGFEPSEDGKNMLGFVAQEVQDIIPEAIESFGGNSITIGDTIIDNPLRVNEKFIIPVLVKAIQELSAKVTLLENAQ
jgi:hypothetical protein